MLSNVDIVNKIKSGEIELVDPEKHPVIDPKTGIEREPGQLQAHGYDLRIEAVYPWKKAKWKILEDGEEYLLKPGEFIAVRTYERIRFQVTIAGTIHSLARKTLLGLSPISTTIHPGWAQVEDGPKYIVVAIANYSNSPVVLRCKDVFCRLIFYQMDTPATIPAPAMQQVSRDFDTARTKVEKGYDKRSALVGWLLIGLSVVMAAAFLIVMQARFPKYNPITIAVVVAALPIVLEIIRRHYDIAPEK